MATLLKDIYSQSFYERFADSLCRTVPDFDRHRFIALIFGSDFDKMELKERIRHTSNVLHRFLPDEFGEATKLIEKIITALREDHFRDDQLEFMFLPDFIEIHGIDHYEDSVRTFVFVTQFVSCEFAVRPFILKYGARMIRQMEGWSLHESARVRRLASEGSRPRLPWAMAIPFLKKDPALILPILETLKSDPSESVRRSVANSLNDIAKDNPQIVLDIAGRWKGSGTQTEQIIKHGCRTLLKQGHAEILKHYGLDSTRITVTNFEILTPEVMIGNSLEFSFWVTNTGARAQTVRLEYAVYYLKANSQLSKKVFKISERTFRAEEAVLIRRRQSFKLITTKRFYPGLHQLSVIVNGAEKQNEAFELLGQI